MSRVARASLVMLFLLVAMTFVNTLEERQVFAALRTRLTGRGLSLRATFWKFSGEAGGTLGATITSAPRAASAARLSGDILAGRTQARR